MKKPLLILLVVFLTISMIPPITIAAPKTMYRINYAPNNPSIVAYTTYNNYIIYAYGMGSSGGYDIELLIVDNNGNIVLNKTVSANVAYGNMDIAANDTGVFIAYQYYVYRAHDIQLVFIDYSGNVRYDQRLAYTDAVEENPVVAWSGNYWLLGFINYTAHNFTVILYDKYFNQVYENSTIAIGNDGAVDYRERAFYSPVTGKFYVVLRAYNTATNSYDLLLVTVDPATMKTTTEWLTSTSGKDEAVSSYGQMYKRYYAEMLGTGDTLLIVYGYDTGSSNIDGLIVNVSSNTITPITISTSNGDQNCYPWIAANQSNWLVTWFDPLSHNIYARFVYPNGSMTLIFTLGTGNYGYITAVYNSQDFTVFFTNQTSGTYDLYAMRISPDGKRGAPVPIANKPGVDEIYEYPLILGTLHALLFTNDTEGVEYLALIDLAEIPQPTLIPTKLTVSITKNDGGDGYLEPGDSITVTGKLIDTGTGLGISGKTIKAILYHNILYWQYPYYGSVRSTILVETNTTGSDGSYSIKMTIPSTIVSGSYFIKVSFAGDNVYASSSNLTQEFLLFKVKPATPTWETIPADISAGPAILVKNGQVIITDPQGDERVELINGTGEESDVDIRSLQLAFDNNYLYIKAVFAGDTTATGEIAPAIVMALDFTPDTYGDGWGAGYTENFKAIYAPGKWDTETHTNNSRAWDVDFVIAPKYPQAYSDDGRIPLYLHIAYYSTDRNRWYYIEELAGYAVFNGNTVEAYLPFDTILANNTHLQTTGIQKIMLFSAVYAINLTADALENPLFANWYDVPGALTYGITPASYLNQGFNEAYFDDYKSYRYLQSWELDTRFVLTMDHDNNRFIGSTNIVYNETELDATPITYKSGHVRAFIGDTIYKVKLQDADNPLYYVYGKTITMKINGTPAESATTDAVGLAVITHTWTSSDWKKTVNINFTFPGDTDYQASETAIYTTKVLYMINITSLNYKFIDVNKDGVITRGDKLNITATVKAWDGTAWVTAPDGVLVKFIIHSPDVILGTAPTQGGVANLLYTFTGNEQLLGTHVLEAAGDGSTSWTPTYPGAQVTVRETFSVLPAPEPPILPVILLAAILLFIIVKKRR